MSILRSSLLTTSDALSSFHRPVILHKMVSATTKAYFCQTACFPMVSIRTWFYLSVCSRFVAFVPTTNHPPCSASIRIGWSRDHFVFWFSLAIDWVRCGSDQIEKSRSPPRSTIRMLELGTREGSGAALDVTRRVID